MHDRVETMLILRSLRDLADEVRALRLEVRRLAGTMARDVDANRREQPSAQTVRHLAIVRSRRQRG